MTPHSPSKLGSLPLWHLWVKRLVYQTSTSVLHLPLHSMFGSLILANPEGGTFGSRRRRSCLHSYLEYTALWPLIATVPFGPHRLTCVLFDLLGSSFSRKERLQPQHNVQSMAHPFYWLTYSKGALQLPQEGSISELSCRNL